MSHLKDDWFTNYEIMRDIKNRAPLFRREDFIGKRVIDIGCNTGQMSRFARDQGAVSVLGVDCDSTAIRIAREKAPDLDFMCDDIENYSFVSMLDNYDTGLLLSVIGTEELGTPVLLLSRLSQKVKVLYIEGHHKVYQKEQLLSTILESTNFTCIEYIGHSYDNKVQLIPRHIFRCSYDIIDRDAVIHMVRSVIECPGDHLIAFQGHGGVGKTHFKDRLIREINPGPDVEIKDDIIYYKKVKRCLLYFDFRVLTYLFGQPIDILFIFRGDIKTRMNNRPECSNDRSEYVRGEINKIYHVQ